MTKTQVQAIRVLTLSERVKQLDIDIRTFKGNIVLRNLLNLWYIRKLMFLSSELQPTKHTKGMSLKIIMKNLDCSKTTAELYNRSLILLEEIEECKRELDNKISMGVRNRSWLENT